jgi:hypothetical protein
MDRHEEFHFAKFIQRSTHMPNHTWCFQFFQIIVGVSVAHNLQTGNNKIELLTEYESVPQSIRTTMRRAQHCQIKLFQLHFHIA